MKKINKSDYNTAVAFTNIGAFINTLHLATSMSSDNFYNSVFNYTYTDIEIEIREIIFSFNDELEIFEKTLRKIENGTK